VSSLPFELQVDFVVAEIGGVARQADCGWIEWRSGSELALGIRDHARFQA
jgi:hypothetical protein